MNKLLILLLLSFFSFTVYPQDKDPVIINEVVAGKNHIYDEDVLAIEYSFPGPIENIAIDRDNRIMTAQLRGFDKKNRPRKKGMLLVYDYENRKTRWSEQIDFIKDRYVYINHKLLNFKGNSTFLIDLDNGKNTCQIKSSLFYIHPSGELAIGSKINSKDMEGFNLATGKSIWKRKINTPYGWNTMTLKDTTLLVYGQGLFKLNITNGQGWDYEASAHSKDYTSSIAASALGIGLGLLTGVYSVRTGADIIHGIHSNVLIENEERIYFASREELICLDFDGNVLWETPLSKDITSRSSIFIDNEFIYLINQGIALFNGATKKHGKPFIASFDKDNGIKNYITPIEGEDFINDYKVCPKEKSLYLLHENALTCYNIDKGSFIVKRIFATTDLALPVTSFARDNVYSKNEDGSFASLPHNIYISSFDNDIYAIDEKLDITGKIGKGLLYDLYFENEHYRFLGNSEETVVIDNAGYPVMSLNVSADSDIIGNKLYDTKDNRILEVDISRFVR